MSTVRLYSTSWCGYCRMAKRLLGERKIPFEEINLDGDSNARRDLAARTGRRTVPQIFIGETHVGGYDDLAALDGGGGLGPLLEREGIR